MNAEPADLVRLLEDDARIGAAAARLAGRRLLLVGTGTSWHAANIGAYWLRLAGLEAWALQAFDADLYGPRPGRGDALVVISHRGTKQFTSHVLAAARRDSVPSVLISHAGNSDADLETVPGEISSAHTRSYLGSLMRLAQLAARLGADLPALSQVPDAVATAFQGRAEQLQLPPRLLEFIGAGPNQWTAAEGALKIRETAYVAAEGLSVEQFLHGPSVAVGADDLLVALDGGGPGADRLRETAGALEAAGVRVRRIAETALGEALSVFPLTVHVQRIALAAAVVRGTNPDSFGLDRPGREQFARIEL